jgi:hypothetical protein
MPARASVFRWLARNQEFRQLYVFARQCQAEDLADEILKIADDSSRDYKKKIGADGKVTWVVDRAHIARCRLRIAARKRILQPICSFRSEDEDRARERIVAELLAHQRRKTSTQLH